MMYELGNWMAAVVFPTPAGPNMNSLSRFVTASGFLARSADIGYVSSSPVIGFGWRRDPPAEDADAAFSSVSVRYAEYIGYRLPSHLKNTEFYTRKTFAWSGPNCTSGRALGIAHLRQNL